MEIDTRPLSQIAVYAAAEPTAMLARTLVLGLKFAANSEFTPDLEAGAETTPYARALLACKTPAKSGQPAPCLRPRPRPAPSLRVAVVLTGGLAISHPETDLTAIGNT